MKRGLFNVLTILSFLLCLATAGLWVRSYLMTDEIYWYGEFRNGNSRMTRFRTGGGGFWFETRRWSVHRQPQTVWQQYAPHYPFIVAPTSPPLERMGFLTANGGGYDFFLAAPYWAPTAMLAPLPLLWTSRSCRRWQQRRRHHRGHCESCDYDLRATPERCPECGRPSTGSG